MMAANAEGLIEQLSTLRTRRSDAESRWRQNAYYCAPRDRRPGPNEDSSERPAVGVGIEVSRKLAAGLFANTYSKGHPWFSLRASRQSLQNVPAVKGYLGKVTDQVLQKIQNSNFAQKGYEMMSRFAAMGMGVLYCDMDNMGRIRFREYSPWDCYVAEDADGLVDTVFREIEFTAVQAVSEFGEDALRSEIRRAAQSESDRQQSFRFVHAVYPRPDGRDDALAPPEEMRFASVYIDAEEQLIVQEGGYRTMPFMVPRFYRCAHGYGGGPADDAEADMATMCRAVLDLMDSTEMAMCPPVFVPDDGDIEGVEMKPGAVNAYNAATGQPIFPNLGRGIQEGAHLIDRQDASVRRMFMVDLFMLLESVNQSQMTATEVIERVEEKTDAIAPVVDRLQTELYRMMIERVVSLLDTAGVLPDPPPELAEEEYEILYTTRLDAKLQTVRVMAVLAAAEDIARVNAAAQEIPEIGAVLKLDKVAHGIAQAYGVDPEWLRSAREAAKYRQQYQAQQDARREQEMAAGKVAPVDLTKRAEAGSPAEMAARALTEGGSL